MGLILRTMNAWGLPALGALFLAGCGGGSGDEDRLKADHRLAQAEEVYTNVDSLKRVGDWSGSGDVLTAWVIVDPIEGKKYASCLSVDLSQQIDNEDDVLLAVTGVRHANCKGEEPTP